jgi:hypothetical protein
MTLFAKSPQNNKFPINGESWLLRVGPLILGLHVTCPLTRGNFFSILLDLRVNLIYFVDSYIIELSIEIFKYIKIERNLYEHTILKCMDVISYFPSVFGLGITQLCPGHNYKKKIK